MMLRYVLLGGALTIVAGGCGGDGKIAPVSGVVTLNGKPIADVAVTFQPIADNGKNVPGPAAFGVTGPDGRYSTKLIDDKKPGATVGRNQVRFSANVKVADTSDEGLRQAKATVKIPARYWFESQIEFDVPPKGSSSADFQLTSP